MFWKQWEENIIKHARDHEGLGVGHILSLEMGDNDLDFHTQTLEVLWELAKGVYQVLAWSLGPPEETLMLESWTQES